MATQLRHAHPQAKSNTEQETRIRREAAVIRDARAEIPAGKGIDDDALEAWLDQLDQDRNAPLSQSVSAKP